MLNTELDINDLEVLSNEFENAHPQDILRWAIESYGQKLVVVTSFQPTGIVTLHMMRQITDQFHVVTLDTGLLFPETYELMDKVESQLGIHVERLKPELTLAQQARQEGSLLWETNPDKCCNIRKTIPLEKALGGYSAWITGLRRDQSATRANVPVVTWDKKYNMVKLCPFADWTEDMIWAYIEGYELPYNVLHDRNYPSIGCYTCTAPAVDGDLRSGRWSGKAKTECGIHINVLGDQQKAG